ncbi:MAG: hypothetical protein IKV48_08490 [Eggerthellaceae bacterium]|nr:hypothetical protein [Eggerthellaceae bacterium]
MDVKKSVEAESRVLSVRVPVQEAIQIDADAKAAGMNRNDFIRMKVRERSTFAKAEKIIELIDVLRQLTIMLDTYLSLLERLVSSPKEAERGKELILVASEVEQAQEMMKLMLKAQRQAVRVLRSMHDDVKR